MIARRRVLLERVFVFLVENDQAQMRRRRKHRAARTDHHLHFAARDPLPMPMPLGIAQVAVQHRDVAEPRSENVPVCGVRLISGTSTIACRP